MGACAHSNQKAGAPSPVREAPASIELPAAHEESKIESQNVNTEIAGTNSPETVNLNPIPKEGPRTAVIIGPGGVRSMAGLGVLQELVLQHRLRVDYVAGFDLGAWIAALYAKSGAIHEVEWQIMKIPEQEWKSKSLLGVVTAGGSSNGVPVENFAEYLRSIFADKKLDDSNPKFVCSSFNSEKLTYYNMERGLFREVLPYCSGSVGFMSPYKNTFSGGFDMRQTVKYLRAKGVKKIIFVNTVAGNGRLIEGNDVANKSALWSLIRYSANQMGDVVDVVIPVDLGDMLVNDFSKRRDAIEFGREVGKKARGLW